MRPPTVATGLVTGLVASAALAHALPSVLVLGQWTRLRTLPVLRCRWRGPARPQIALTFDDGPAPDETVQVLDLLATLGIPATFFCLGEQVARHPDIAREIAAGGHTVGTHGHRHVSHFRRSPGAVRADLDEAFAAHLTAGLTRPTWFRPPFGHVTSGTLLAARRAGVALTLWSAMGREWSAPDGDAVAARIEHSIAPGTIVLLHDTDVSNPAGSTARVLAALPRLASAIDRQGLAAVTLDDLVTPV